MNIYLSLYIYMYILYDPNHPSLSNKPALNAEPCAGVEERHKAEEDRLQASLRETRDQGTAMALQQSLRSNTPVEGMGGDT